MTGAIVVGDGTGVGNGEFVSVRPFKAPAPPPEAGSGGWMMAGAVGLLLGAAAGIGLSRLRGAAVRA